MRDYIHYGSDQFDLNRFNPVKNIEGWNKPDGGLWASPVGARRGWKEWCKDEEFCVWRLKQSFTFGLRDGTRVLHIRSFEELGRLPVFRNSAILPIDFEKLKEEWDVIELHLSEDVRLYSGLYGWDCDCILVMNPEVVQEIDSKVK